MRSPCAARTPGRSSAGIATPSACGGSPAGWRRSASGAATPSALMMTNRPEFHPCDTAALHLGATPFSVYNTSSPEQIAYVFANAGNRVVITERAVPRPRSRRAGEHGGLEHVVCVDGGGDGVLSLDELEQLGRRRTSTSTPPGERSGPTTWLTLIYTSGTTGPPKGVELTHANILAQCRAVGEVLPLRRGDRITSYLPSAHVADRWSAHYNQMVYGLQITTRRRRPADRRRAAPRCARRSGAASRGSSRSSRRPSRRRSPRAGCRRRAALEKALEVALTRCGRSRPASRSRRSSRRRMPSSTPGAVAVARPNRPRPGGVDRLRRGAALVGACTSSCSPSGFPLVELYGMSECSCAVTVCDPAEAQDRDRRHGAPRRRAAPGRRRRAARARPDRDARLPRRPGAHRRGDRPRRLAAHRRHRRDRR